MTRDTADHSMPYITARAMFDGDITNDSYAPAKLKESRILAFIQKITVAEDPVLTANRRRCTDTHHRYVGGRAAGHTRGQRHSRFRGQADAEAGHPTNSVPTSAGVGRAKRRMPFLNRSGPSKTSRIWAPCSPP